MNLLKYLTRNYLTFIILFFIILGATYRVVLTSNSNFLFHIDNARDMVDVREMVVLKHLRLTGPTSGIEGVYNGPAWYYIMVIPFLISGGDPYAFILLEIIFWGIGAFFLLKIVSKWGVGATASIGSIWLASNLVVLSSENSLSTNPVLFLMPVFLWSVDKSLQQSSKAQRYYLFSFFLAGLFFNLEMAFGIVLPVILFLVHTFYNRNFFKSRNFLYGLVIFGFFLLPQLIFDFRHQLIMLNSIFAYINHQSQGIRNFDPFLKAFELFRVYRNVFSGLLMNNNLLQISAIFLVLILSPFIWLNKNIEKIVIISVFFFFLPFFVYLFLPISVMSWHILGEMVALLILLGFSIGYLKKKSGFYEIISWGITLFIVFVSLQNVVGYLQQKSNLQNDASLFGNEIKAIDYIYEKVKGENFRVYTYLPSVVDYPYQYLFWWYGLKKYGYTPIDYAYLPNKPEYIKFKQEFIKISAEKDSGLIFLIKEPDRIGIRHLWENSFKSYQLINKEKAGPLEIEVKK